MINTLNFFNGRTLSQVSVACPAGATTVLVPGVAGQKIYVVFWAQGGRAPAYVYGGSLVHGAANTVLQSTYSANTSPFFGANSSMPAIHELPAGDDLKWLDTGAQPTQGCVRFYQF